MFITKKEAAQLLGVSPSTIQRCVARGAPVHRWGAAGRYYRIDPEEFISWMEDHGKREHEQQLDQRGSGANLIQLSTEQMAARRREMIAALA